jgi:hypothetical protein
MSEHSRKDRVNKEKAATNRKGAPPPTREPQVALGHDRIEISDPELMGGKR